ncbi:hydroxamate siderophore iron reductase FhuF, partial [Salmonella enterica subsp. enterica serovar Oslo]|nr:hydroxamate siderophore iron reductase FhuF [Salmonella enterica subsp. enterica serovar Oslo]
MESLVVSALQPVIRALGAPGDCIARLLGSSPGYVSHWYRTVGKPLLGVALLARLRRRGWCE